MVHFRDKYKVASYCRNCSEWVPEPTYSIIDLAIGILPNPDIDKHPEIQVGKVWYDEKGWKHTILARLCLLTEKWVKKIICPKCKKQCSGGPLSKTKKIKPYIKSDKPRGRRPGPDIYKEQVTYWVEQIKQTKNTTYEVTLEDVEPQHLQSRIKKKLEKDNETKNSHVT